MKNPITRMTQKPLIVLLRPQPQIRPNSNRPLLFQSKIQNQKLPGAKPYYFR
jgi:hypothetical protein